LFNKYAEYLPKLLELGKKLEPAVKFIEDFSKNILKGVIGFIEFGYKTYDSIHNSIKKIGGEGAAKTFDELSKNLNLVLTGAVATAALVLSTSPKGKTSPQGTVAGAQGALGKPKPGTGGRPKVTDRVSGGQKPKISIAGRFKGIARFTGKTFGRIPIIGGLVNFLFALWSGENPGRAAARAVGSTIGSALGTFIPVPFAGTILGGILGDIVGGALYDTVAGQPKPQAKAQGGVVTRGGQSQVAPKRKIKTTRTKPLQKIQPQKTQLGKDVGGKLKIEQLYGTDEPGKRSALRALKKSSEDVKKIKSLGGLPAAMFGAGIDMSLGQRPDKNLANSLGGIFGSVIQSAVDAELNSSFGDISKSLGMSNGGVVPSREIGNKLSIGERVGKFISKALAISIESSAAKILQNLNREMQLEGAPAGEGGGGDGSGPGGAGPDVFHGMGAERMWNFFKNKGLSDFAVSGILGNARWESTFNPTARGKGMGPGGSDAIGIFQWGETARWKDLVNWAKQQNLNPWDYDTQLKFAWHEMQTTEKATIPAIQGATSASDAAEKFRAVYERSSHTEQRRKDAAEGFYSQYKGKTYIPPATRRGGATNYKPRSPGLFNAIEYITGDSTQGSNYDESGHGGLRYHEHIAFKNQADKERAKAALRAKGFTIGSEYRRGDRGYHGSGLSIDVPFYPNNRLGYSDDKKGEQRFSKDVRKILGIDGGSSRPSPARPPGQTSGYQASLAPTQSSTVASLNMSGVLKEDTSTTIYNNNAVAILPIETGISA